MKRPAFTLVELIVSLGLFMVAISVALVATIGTNSLVARTDARSAIAESARSVSDTLRRSTSNAPVGSVALHGYYNVPDAFAGVQVRAFSIAQAQNTCEVVGRAAASQSVGNEEVYTLNTTGDVIAYWVYRVDSSLQCPLLGTHPLYQNRLTSTAVRATGFQVQMNSYDCDPGANCTTKQQLRYSFTLELAAKQSGRAAETRSASTTVTSSVPIGLVGTGIIPVNILTTELPDGAVNTPYSKAILGEGGKLPYQWSVTGGALPPGLTLGTLTGLISGTPTTSGPSSVTITLGDSSNPQLTDTQEFAFSITGGGGGGLRISTEVLPIGTVNAAYSTTLEATGGVGQLTWTVISGALPPGLTLGASTGLISGTPTTAGPYFFTIQVRDTTMQQDSQELSLLIEVEGGGCGGHVCGGEL